MIDPTAEPLAKPSESFSRVFHDNNNSIAEQTAASAGPQIVLHPSESVEGALRPARQSLHGLGRSQPTEVWSSHESLDLDGPCDPSDAVDIPQSVECFFHITFDGATKPIAANSSAINYTEPSSYQKVEKIAQDLVRVASSGVHPNKQINFKYGNCTVIGDHVEKIGLPLTTQEDWESVCAILKNYWRSDPLRTLRVDIFRDYFSYRSRATSEVSLAATKRQEMYNLIKWAWDDKPYISRTVLMRFNSPENIREIIIQDHRLDMEPGHKERFIHSVQSKAACLLALCVYNGLKMECLNILLLKGFSDAALPLQRRDCCHDKCGPDFANLLKMRGCCTAARFDNVGEHQDFHDSVVIPIHFVPVEEDQDEIMKAGRQKDIAKVMETASRVTDDVKQSACCGSGAYSNVYRVRIDPDHHRLSKVSSISLIPPCKAEVLQNKDLTFALKEFKDRPNRIDKDFQQELRVLDELRKYPLKHIVTHLATWTQGGRYYMLFPYAQCNLREYMKWVRFGGPTKENIIWLLRQFRGLAEALKGIHDLSGTGALEPAPSLVTRPLGERKAGYHHDLKPENILFYKFTDTFEISDFGSGKVHTYRSGSYNTSSANGTLTYEPPEAAKLGSKTSRPYDVWSLGCVFLELLIWAVLGFQEVEDFRSKRLDRRYPGSQTDTVEDDGFWQMLQNGDITVRKSVDNWTQILKEAILQQQSQPFKEVLDLVLRMLETVKETRIPALDLYDTLDRIYKQKRIDLENVNNDSLPDSNGAQERSLYLPRLSLKPPDRRSPERTREGAAVTVRNTGNARVMNATGDFLTTSPLHSTSPNSPRGTHRRNSSASEFLGRSRNTSIASSNMSTHGRHGSHDERI